MVRNLFVVLMLLVPALLSLHCAEDKVTQLFLLVHFPEHLGLDQLQLSGEMNNQRSFPPVWRPEQPTTALSDPQSLTVLLPDNTAGQEVTLQLKGLKQGTSLVESSFSIRPRLRETVSLEIWLGQSADAGLEGPPGEQLQCLPYSFVDCQEKLLRRCTANGTGLESEDCAPFFCNSLAERCNECDPLDLAQCSDKTLFQCTSDGLIQQVSCPLGCANGACCEDKDKDSHTTCAGDCDDLDPDAYPGQDLFFSVPSKGTGSYDYNCDTTAEQKWNQVESCVRVGTLCQGDGWQSTIPACGEQGSFHTCKTSGRSACAHEASIQIQACR